MNSAPSSNGIWRTRRFRRSRKIDDLLLPTMQHCKRHEWRPRALGIGWQPSLAHGLSFECAGLALGKQADKFVLLFDSCRRKRNVIDYTGVRIATSTEAADLLQGAQEFSALVESWIKATHPYFV